MQKIDDMDERYIATVDLGTSKIALTVARMFGESIEVICYKQIASDGIRGSRVFNPMKAAAPLKKILSEAEEELGIKILQVAIGLPRYCVKQETSSANGERKAPSSCITAEEVAEIKSLALDTYPIDDPDKEEIYGAVAQSFGTDDMINLPEDDLIGMTGSSIEGNFKLFIGARNPVSNIDIMLNDAGVAPARKFFLPDATAKAILTLEEKENGVALIEMGAGVTSLSIYQGNILRHYCSIPFGGKTITNDIKYVCGFREVLAENIKMAFGACMPDRLQSMSEKVIQVNYDEDGSSKQVEVKFLSEIITARVREIFEAMLFKIQDSGYADKLRGGIVITGGGANLTGCSSFLKEISGYNVRIGYPRQRNITAQEYPAMSDTGAAASIGMLLLAQQDTHLACTTAPEIPATSKEAPAQEPETETFENYEGTVFGAIGEEDAQQKKEKVKKAPKQESSYFKNMGWTQKIVEAVGNLFDTVQN